MKVLKREGSLRKKTGVLFCWRIAISPRLRSVRQGESEYIDMIPVALLRANLDGETARIACRVGRTTLATDGREARGRARLVADLAEELGARQVRDVIGDLEDAVGSATLGVDDTLADK